MATTSSILPPSEPPAFPIAVEGDCIWVAMGPYGLLKEHSGALNSLVQPQAGWGRNSNRRQKRGRAAGVPGTI
jgi:hypothetical protein